jgi:nucleotidyltransferase/DNA polymerase involved in DNA repair
MFSAPTAARKKAQSERLSSLPNLGPVMEKALNRAGIQTVSQFRTLGWRATVKKLVKIHPRYRHSIYAQVLIGALKNQIWHQISDADKKASKTKR